MWSSHRHIRNEEESYYKILHKYNPLIFALIYKKINNREDALDVFQNVIIHIWEYRSSLSPDNIDAIIKKTCIQEIAHFYRKAKNSYVSDLPLEHADTTNDELLLKEEKEQSMLEIERAIEELIPPIRRQIFKMNKVEGITQDKIATYLKLPKRTVEYHIYQSIIYLKNRVKSIKIR